MLEVHVEGPLTASEPGVGIRAALDGAGLVQLPRAYLAEELVAGRLVALLEGWVQPRIDPFFLYYPGRRQMRPPLKALADFLRSAYRGMPPAAGREAGASRGVGAPARATPSP
jgi:DNA-binding transcriptional LysR family regulator